MRNKNTALALAALLALASVSVAQRPWRDLAGDYVADSGRTCTVSRVGTDYVFTNDSGASARMRFMSPNQLAWVSGLWDPNIVATLDRDRRGRLVIRFDAPFTPPGHWVRAY
ncbi:MAG: hypothetical protein K2W96_21985 [Gemmataceae bacterium]|nr:hypothetical protein [Gemmataceae bacterium]